MKIRSHLIVFLVVATIPVIVFAAMLTVPADPAELTTVVASLAGRDDPRPVS